MTDLLKDTLREYADTEPPPRFDADRIIHAGQQRVARSRLTTGFVAAGVASIVAAGALGLAQIFETGDQLTASPAPPYAERKVSFAVGDVVYWGKEHVSMQGAVSSYVRTDDGFVYTTADGGVWFHDGRGAERIGESANRRLRADDAGSLVAWVDLAEDGHPQYVVYDTASRTELARVDDSAAGPSRDPGDEGAEVLAVDDGAAYWRVDGGIARYDVESGDIEEVWTAPPVVDPANKPPRVTDVVDVADGTIAYVLEGEQGSRMMVGPEIGEEARPMPSGWHGVLSPDATYLGVEEADELAVYDTATGEDVTPDLERYPFKVVYGWVDDDTAMVLAIQS
ncbi:MAG TPA: hypothetical protein VFY11_04365, partial [Nocardioidaceae bacterium]|nr:hypothetical protein [Nocardioidaceae bacterium]